MSDLSKLETNEPKISHINSNINNINNIENGEMKLGQEFELKKDDTSLVSINDPNITPKKRTRGRPKKNQLMTTNTKKTTTSYLTSKPINQKRKTKKTSKDNDIFLHFPISMKDVEDLNKSVFEKTTSNNQGGASDVEEITQCNNIFTINDIHTSSSDNSQHMNEYVNNELIEQNKKLKQKILELETEVEKYKNAESILNKMDNNVYKIDTNIVNVEDGQVVVIEKTNIVCWWCTHHFDTVPIFIPDSFYNSIYNVFGCFCTFNCAYAYILNMNDSSVWYRYSLLNMLYKNLISRHKSLSSNDNDTIITPAPRREVFEKFGGKLPYSEYKKNGIINRKEYRLIMPPMTSINPIVEERRKESPSMSISSLNSCQGLRRYKPLPNVRNNLMHTLKSK